MASVSLSPVASNSSQPDNLAIFCREVRNLLRSKPNCMIPFSKFVPAYHNHYGRQCCVYQFGYTKLIELLESIPHVVQIIGYDNNQQQQQSSSTSLSTISNSSASSLTNLSSTIANDTNHHQQQQQQTTNSNNNNNNLNQRYITLTHREQIKRFASDLIKVVKSQPGKRLRLSKFAQAYEQVLGRTFRVLDYGTNNINVLLAEIWEGTINIIPIKRDKINEKLNLGSEDEEQEGDKFVRTNLLKPLFVNVPLQTNSGNKATKLVSPILQQLVASHKLVNKPYITEQYPDCWFEIPKRERSEREIKRTKYFIWDVIELLSKMKQTSYSVQFSKFIPAYHYYFNRQCKVSIFGFSKLIDLFESISPEIVEIIDQGPGEEKIIQLAKKYWPSSASPTSLNYNNNNFATKNVIKIQQNNNNRVSGGGRGRDRGNNNNNNNKRVHNNHHQNNEQQQQANNYIQNYHNQHQYNNNNNNTKQSSSVSLTETSTSSSCSSSSSSGREAMDCGPTEEEMIELEDELEAYEQLEAIRNKRSTRMAAILDIFK